MPDDKPQAGDPKAGQEPTKPTTPPAGGAAGDELPSDPEALKKLVHDLRTENASRRVKLNEYESQAEKDRKEREAREKAEAEEKGKFKDLYEKEAKKAARLEAEKAELERQQLRAKVLKALDLPDAAADFITGNTEEEMTVSGQKLKGILAAKAGGDTDGSRGRGGGKTPGDRDRVKKIQDQKAASGRYSM